MGRHLEVIAVVLSCLLALSAARADTITVTSDADTNGGPGCTLRAAISAANSDAVAGGCPAGCDDGNDCTADVCTAGECSNTDINGVSCSSDSDCNGPSIGHSTCQAGSCVCPGAGTRAFMVRAGSDPNAAAVTGPTSVQMEAGSTIDIEVFFQDPFDLDNLNAYQLIFPWLASGGASGTVSYVNVNPGDDGCMWCMDGGNSVNIDKANPDWVYINSPFAAGLPSWFNETTPTIFGVIYNYFPGSEIPVCGSGCGVPHCCLPNYIAQFSLTASSDASGVFTFPFNISPVGLRKECPTVQRPDGFTTAEDGSR
jgi:CSLREA domain-containing protein